MPTTPPPDRPTERLAPSPAPRPVHEERAGAPDVDANLVLMRLEDAIGSLRTGLMIVGVIAVAALGVAVYALVTRGEDSGAGSRSGLASDARVARLDDRIDRLSRQIQGLRSAEASGASGAAVDDRVAALERTVKTLAERPSADPQAAIDELSGRIDEIAQDVEALQQGQTSP